jgi:hypothetical protein
VIVHHPTAAHAFCVEIGKPRRTYTIEPVQDPVPRERPAPPPEKPPPKRQPQPKEVPAR